jgi:hypothetical protein
VFTSRTGSPQAPFASGGSWRELGRMELRAPTPIHRSDRVFGPYGRIEYSDLTGCD